jgi:hypothetical protein
MVSHSPSHITVFLDSGATSGVILNNDSVGNPTYASWVQTIANPINIPDPGEYEVGIASAVYRTPFGPIPNTVDTEDGTSSVLIYADILLSSSIGDSAYTVLARIPPIVAFYDPTTRDPEMVAPGSWPTPFIEQSTVIPWVPLGMGIIRQITITFASSRGEIIPTSDLTDPTPFNIVLVIRKKTR